MGGNNKGGHIGYRVPVGLQNHFKSINKKVEALLGKREGMIELEGAGQLIKSTLKEIVQFYLKDSKESGDVPSDTTYWIEYDDNSYGYWSDASDAKNIKLTGIRNVIISADWGYQFYGPDVRPVNYNELYAGQYGYGKNKDGDDWRVETTTNTKNMRDRNKNNW